MGINAGNKTITTFRVVFWLAVMAGLYISSLYDYLFFHSVAELFSVAIAAGVFFVAWNARRVIQNNYLTILGIAFLFVGIIDVLHTLSYKGMGVFPGYGANLPTQFWIAARYLESITFLIAPLFIGRRLKTRMTLGVYLVMSALLVLSIFSGIFPNCFIEGQGLTPFKKYSEYLISAILVGAIVLLNKKREHFSHSVLRLLQASLVLTIFAELAFTFYVSVYGLSNLLGHLFKIFAFYFIYLSLVEVGLAKPYELLFRELKQSEQKYQSLFSRMIDGFAYHKIVTNEQGKAVDYIFMEVNDAFERLTGLNRRDIIGKRVTESLPGIGKDPADWIGTYGKVALGGEEILFEQYAAQLDRWYSVSAYSPERGYFAAIFEDITARKQAEKSLRESEERFRSTLENMIEGCQIIGFDWRYLYINAVGAAHGRKSVEELTGRTMMEAYPGIENTEMFAVLKRCMEDRKAQHMENEFAYPNGETAWFQLSIQPVPEGIFILSLDITDRKQAEAQLKEYSEELTKYSLALEKNNVELQNLVSQKEMLMKEVHHRVKNNFLIVYSLLRFQSMHAKDIESREMFKESQDRVRAMSLLHEKLYKSEDMENIDFADFIGSMAQQLVASYQVASDTVRLRVDIPRVEVDVDLMVPCGLIVNELITNSLKYAFPDGGYGEIHIGGEIDSQGKFTLAVKDNGRGLPDGFETMKTGTLGMELVHMLVDQLEGTLEIVNENGAEFRIGFNTHRFSAVNPN